MGKQNQQQARIVDSPGDQRTLHRLKHSSHRTERTFLRIILWGVFGLLVFGGICFGVLRAWVHWDSQRWLKRAHGFVAAGDVKSAGLMARRAFQMNPDDVEACRLLAELGERDGQSSAIGWREQAVALRPDSKEDQVALAKTALQFDKVPVAEKALEKIRGKADQFAPYHEALAALALTKRDWAMAQKHFAEAIRLAPNNKAYQLKLALLQMRSGNPEERDGARKRLEQFLEDPESRGAATRALRDDAAGRRDPAAALDYSARLAGYPESAFRDRLSHVQVLRTLKNDQFAGKLEELQNEAGKDPGKLTVLLAWMSANQLALLALDWTKRLPPEMLKQKPVFVSVADCYVATNDWAGVTEWCKKANWLDLEFLRHAYLARAARARDDDLAQRSEWNLALRDAGADGDRVLSLEQIAARWGWKSEAEELLWTLGRNPEKQQAALLSLNQYYTEKGQTNDLFRVVARLYEINPNDEQVQNNLAQLSLLLNVNAARAYGLAEQLYKKHPDNAAYASTYAFSLYHRGQFKHATEIMNALPAQDLAEPNIAVYYGILLAGAGDKERASGYLELAPQATLLPEEKALVEKAELTTKQ